MFDSLSLIGSVYPVVTGPIGQLRYNDRPFGLCLVARADVEETLLWFMQLNVRHVSTGMQATKVSTKIVATEVRSQNPLSALRINSSNKNQRIKVALCSPDFVNTTFHMNDRQLHKQKPPPTIELLISYKRPFPCCGLKHSPLPWLMYHTGYVTFYRIPAARWMLKCNSTELPPKKKKTNSSNKARD